MQERTCVICGTDITDRRRDAEVCAQRRCVKARDRLRQRRIRSDGSSVLPWLGGGGGTTLARYYEALVLDPCVYCGAPSEATDHIEPRGEGVSNDWTNLSPVCTSCNTAKRRRTLLGFLLVRTYDEEREQIATLDAWQAENPGIGARDIKPATHKARLRLRRVPGGGPSDVGRGADRKSVV